MPDTQQFTIDPSALTTQQIWREVGALKELLENRFEAVDRSIVLAHDDMVRVPTEVQKAVGHLKELHEEKFRGVYKQLEERDERYKQSAAEGRVALAAALQAAKELVVQQNVSAAESTATQSANLTKQIDALALIQQATAKASDDKIVDIKDRLTRIESGRDGAEKNKLETRDTNKYVVGLVGMVIGALLGMAGFALSLLKP